MTTPRPTTTPIARVNPALLGSPAERDAFADEMLRQERLTPDDINRIAAIEDELYTEGKLRRPIPLPND